MSDINYETGEITTAPGPTLRTEMSPEINELITALVAARIEISNPKKVTSGNRGSYADLPAVIEATEPALSKAGIFASQVIEVVDGAHYLCTMLAHSSGQYMRSYCELNADHPKAGSPDQAMGASISYMRRYTLCAALGIQQGGNDKDPDQMQGRDTGNYSQQSGRRSRPVAAEPEPKPEPAPVTRDSLLDRIIAAEEALKNGNQAAQEWLKANTVANLKRAKLEELQAYFDLIVAFWKSPEQAVTA